MEAIPFHPLAEKYPLLGPYEMGRMEENIRRIGLINPIVRWKCPGNELHGSIIDGRNRSLACAAAGVDPRYVWDSATEEELPYRIAALNEERRHLTPEFLKEKRSGRRERVVEARSEGKSLRQIAEDEDVSLGTIQHDLKQGEAVEVPAGIVVGRDGRRRQSTGTGGPKKKDKDEDRPPATQEESEDIAKSWLNAPAGTTKVVYELEPDEWGIPIQEHAKLAFTSVPRFDELTALIKSAQKLFNELANEPGGVFLTLPEVSSFRRGKKQEDGTYDERFVHEGLERALKQVQNAAPAHTVCPWNYAETAHPKDCPTCKDLNWAPALGKNFSKEIVERVKEAFASREAVANL